MSDPISEYQRWKQEGEDLRSKAKHAIEVRFRELLIEAARLAEEYRQDFGKPLSPPASVTAFRYKTAARPAAKGGKSVSKEKPAQADAAPKGKTSPTITALQKRLAAANKKLAAAREAGRPTKDLEDKVYEIEDDLRLALS